MDFEVRSRKCRLLLLPDADQTNCILELASSLSDYHWHVEFLLELKCVLNSCLQTVKAFNLLPIFVNVATEPIFLNPKTTINF